MYSLPISTSQNKKRVRGPHKLYLQRWSNYQIDDKLEEMKLLATLISGHLTVKVHRNRIQTFR